MIAKRLSTKLNWTPLEAESAVKELRDYSKLYDTAAILRVFESSKNYKERTNSFKDFILTSLTKISMEQFSNYIIQILNVDSCFRALALLNAADINDSKTNHSFKILYPNDKKSLIYWKLSFQDQSEESLHSNQIFNNELLHYVEPERLSYDFANTALKQVSSELSNYPQVKDFIGKLLENTGFTAFNLSLVQNHFSDLSYKAFSNRESLISYMSVLNNTFLDRNTVNNKRYWLIFVLVEELMARGYGTRESFRESEQVLGEKKQTIQRRYYEMKKEFEKENLETPQIVNKYGLGEALHDLILRLI